MHLVLANKLYSSWSMRPWLVMKHIGLEFEETVIPLRQPDTTARIAEFSPSGKLPVLIDGTVRVWDSLAIISHLADRFPDDPVWPAGVAARAHAKAISCEMHSGFMALRKACPMNLAKRFKARSFDADVMADVARVLEIWRTTRDEFGGADGPFLFGGFTAADAMYAPVVNRLYAYRFEVDEVGQTYMEAVMAHPLFAKWTREAFKEPWRIAAYEEGHVADEDLIAAASGG